MKKIFPTPFIGIMLVIALLVFSCPGCGPSEGEIRAQEQARLESEARARAAAEAKRQAEEARKKAEAEKIAQINAFETAGDEALQQGQPIKALEDYQEVLKRIQRYSDQDQRVRQKIIKVILSMPAPPAVPESVMRSMVRGETRLKIGGAGSFDEAAKEMEQAALDAPWVADIYFNLGVVREKAGEFGKAMEDLRLYLLADPRSKNAEAVKARIYELEVMKEDQEKMQAMQGEWTCGSGIGVEFRVSAQATVTVKGSKIFISIRSDEFQMERKGSELNGFVTVKGYTDSYPTLTSNGAVPCSAPGYTEAVTGHISEDGRSIVLHGMEQNYKFTYDAYSHCRFGRDCGEYPKVGAHCIGVALESRSKFEVKCEK